MRSRNLKPGFFKNEELAEIEPLGRILYAGLWCMADREGRLEDRPKRIKVEVLPYDSCNINRLLDILNEKHFIIRYSISGNNFISIPTFKGHQSPHIKEQDSTIPAPDSSGAKLVPPDLQGASPVQEPDSHECSPPDSLFTDSLNPSTDVPIKPIVPPDGVTKFSVQDLANLWNEKSPPDLPRVDIPFRRKPKDMEKIRDAVKRNPGREWWERVIDKLYGLPFVRGQNDRTWKISLDVVVRDAEKILDGKYASGKPQPKGLASLIESAERHARKKEEEEDGGRQHF